MQERKEGKKKICEKNWTKELKGLYKILQEQHGTRFVSAAAQ